MKDGERETFFIESLPKCLKESGLGQAESWSQETNLHLLHGEHKLFESSTVDSGYVLAGTGNQKGRDSNLSIRIWEQATKVMSCIAD